ncbi:MAG: Sca4 family protein [Rickettsiaceae bacterium]|nr:Sca4 family protein [Rickettsiaceae bacterium]
MAKGDYQAATRQQRRLAQQYFNTQKIDTDIQTLSIEQFQAIETMHLKDNGTDHILGPTEEQLERVENYLQGHPELNTTFEQLSDKEITVIDPTYKESQAIAEAPVVEAEKQPALSMQEIMKQEAEKRRTAMGYDEEDRDLNPKPATLEQQLQEEISKRAAKKQEAQKPITQEIPAEEMAQDSVIFGAKSNNTVSVSVSDTIDPITAAIREEIIKKQQQLLQTEIANNIENETEKEAFQKQDLTALRAYLATEEGKESAAKIMQNPEMQTKMHAIEKVGYKTVHNQFQDSFRNVDWGAGASKIRTTNITNENGDDVCALKETTIDTAPTSLLLDDGSTRTVTSYRQIDFPKGLEADHGPLHLSMALKDENGRNMPEKDAVYFTAHYDESGKLTEVSSPVPVKFMGEGADAIGYIERNGKVYTLPVTQGKYHEMMQEVSKNHGMNVDISQTVEATQELAQDKVITPEKSGEIIKEEPKKEQAQAETIDTPLPSNEFEEQLQTQKAKLNPVRERVLAEAPTPQETFEEQLQTQKAKLNPVRERVLAEAPTPQETLEEQLKAQKAKLKPTGEKAPTKEPKETLQVLSEPPVKNEATIGYTASLLAATQQLAPSIDELASVLTVNAFTGKTVAPEVVIHVQAIRAKLDPNTPQPQVVQKPSQEVEVSTEQATQQASEMLTGKNDKEAQTIITQAAKSGKSELVTAMVAAVTKESPDQGIPKVGMVKLAAAYHDAMASVKATSNKVAQNSIKNACGKIAAKANINHVEQVASKSAGVSR